jgi:hypothetical protein
MAAVERVRADIAALRSQIAGWLFQARPSPKRPSREYQRALLNALANRR